MGALLRAPRGRGREVSRLALLRELRRAGLSSREIADITGERPEPLEEAERALLATVAWQLVARAIC